MSIRLPSISSPVRLFIGRRISPAAVVILFANCLFSDAGLGEAANLAAGAGKPNFVIIYADDLGWGDVACYGHAKFKTPNLDRMAAEGAKLTNFYSVCPYCAPSRYGLLTGRYPNRGGMSANPAPDAGPQADALGIRDDERTLGEMFQSAGYATACVGKWHLGHKPQFMPTRHGFDEYFGILYSNDMRPVQLMDDEQVAEYPVDQNTLTKRYTERCLAFLDKNRDKPFFLYVPQVMVHKPLAASETFYKQTGTGLYGDALAELDWSVGQILDKLKSLGLDERTFVFFSSDNGPWFGGSTGGLRGMKGQGFEGGIRVPLIARRPGVIPAGHVSDQPAAIIDLFPTVLKACGIESPVNRDIDGRDILPLLTSSASSPHEQLFTVMAKGVITVRKDNWKLHVGLPYGAVKMPDDGSRWIDPRGPDGTTIVAPPEQYQPSELPGPATGDPVDGPTLFDLAIDAAETKNVASAHPDVVADLLARVERFRDETKQASLTVPLRSQVQAGPTREFVERTEDRQWDPHQTCVIVCDMWDAHHCLNAVRRAEEMAPRMNAFLQAARERGILVIHAPSSCMAAYEGHPGRVLAQSAPTAVNLPKDIGIWCRHIPAEDRAAYPIEQSDSEDDDPDEHRAWHEKLAALGRNPQTPWVRQMDALTIAPGDAISDDGTEIWHLLESRGIRNVMLVGVHTNMCVLGRPFGLRQMSKNGKHTVLVRDLTDTMYNPKQRPYVSHHEGTRLIVEYVERTVCPTTTSCCLLGGEPFRFKE